MGLFSFVKDAGKAIGIGGDDGQTEVDEKVAQMQADHQFGVALKEQLVGLGLEVEDLSVKFAGGRATLVGTVGSMHDKEKLVVAAGNTVGVETVEDLLTIGVAEDGVAEGESGSGESSSTFYTVKSGDTLSLIAKEHYGDPMKYTQIFEANRPMLENPDLIYPGQVLLIPPIG